MPSIEDLKAAAEALNRGEHRREITKEEDLKNVMKQIMAIEGPNLVLPTGGDSGSVLSPAETATTPAPQPSNKDGEAEAPSPAVAASPPVVPKPPATPPAAPNWLHNIVQVVSKEGRHFGRTFQLGDIREGKAHGYIIKEHGAIEHITVPADHIATVGGARIKSKYPCSDKWIAEHMGEK